jgi:2-succinyl-5-enolpyruvyl-6-hydroxy-3-cyclohexene-1-carboxylate synthase
VTVSPAATFSSRLVRAFAALGVEHAIVSPGSRSQALALALAELETEGLITVHVRIDERVAAFTALGIARESGKPALVVTTSGTAVANLLPAVVESSHSGVPMLVLTADRPASLRGTGSNQTTIQPGMFGSFARAEVDLEAPTREAIPDARALASWAYRTATNVRARGAVHLNLQFVEPLSGEVAESGADQPVGGAGPTAEADAGPTAEADAGPTAEAASRGLRIRHLAQGPRTIVVAGADAGEVANEFALHAGWPLIAEVSSGARFGPNLVGAYRRLLDHPDFGERVERVVVFGHPTLSRQLPALFARPGLEIVVVTGAGAAFVPTPAAHVVDEVTADAEDRSHRAARAWTGQWVFAGRELQHGDDETDEVAPPVVNSSGPSDVAAAREFARGELAALRAPVSRRSLALAVWRASWPHDRLVLGASRLIRELDGAAPGKRIPVHSNRGLAGIDGTISTAIGVAIASQTARGGPRRQAGTTRVLLGDLAFLHDVGALLRAPGEPSPRVQVIVGNDHGGTIFDGLEVAGSADPTAFDRVMYTPQQVDFPSLAAAYGWEHRRVSQRGELDSVLASPAAGCSIVEVELDR